MLVEQSDGTKKQIVALDHDTNLEVDLDLLSEKFKHTHSSLSDIHFNFHKLTARHPHFFSPVSNDYEPRKPELLKKLNPLKEDVFKNLVLPHRSGTLPHALKFVLQHFEDSPDSQKTICDVAQEVFDKHLKTLSCEYETITSKLLPINEINKRDRRLNLIQANFRLRSQALKFEIEKYETRIMRHFVEYVQLLIDVPLNILDKTLDKNYVEPVMDLLRLR